MPNKEKKGALKKIVFFSCALTISISVFSTSNFALAAAKSSIVVDGNTGEVLHQNNPDALRFPASITKVMTLFLLFEQLDAGKLTLDSQMIVSSFASNQAPSKLGLQIGQEISVRTAINALSIKSANDVAVVVAEHIGGTERKFAQMMTQKARQIGMKNTTFVNASGLPDKNQVTTARDLALLGYAVQSRFPQYSKAFAKREFSYNGREMGNHNKLLGRVEGIDGIKTGYTRLSGFNLLSSMRINGKHLIGVVLGGDTGRERDVKMHQLLADNFDHANPKKYALRQFAGRTLQSETDIALNDAAVEQLNVPNQKNLLITTNKDKQIANGKPLMLASSDPTDIPVSSNFTGVIQPENSQKKVVRPSAVEKVTPKEKPKITSNKTMSTENVTNEKETLKSSSSTIKKSDLQWHKGQGSTKIVSSDKEVTVPKPKNLPGSSTSFNKGNESHYGVQIAAVPSKKSAKDILIAAKAKAKKQLKNAYAYTEPVKITGETLHRARFNNLNKSTAESACEVLKKSNMNCMVTRL